MAAALLQMAAAAAPAATDEPLHKKTPRPQDIRKSFLNALKRVEEKGKLRRRGSKFNDLTKEQIAEGLAFVAEHKDKKDYHKRLDVYLSERFKIESTPPPPSRKRKWNDIHSEQLHIQLLCADGHVRIAELPGTATLQTAVRVVTDQVAITPGELILVCDRTGEVLVDAKQQPSTLHASELLRMVSLYASPQNIVRIFVGAHTEFKSDTKESRWVSVKFGGNQTLPFALHPGLVFKTFHEIVRAAFRIGTHETIALTAHGDPIPATESTMGAMGWLTQFRASIIDLSVVVVSDSSSSSSSAAAAAAADVANP